MTAIEITEGLARLGILHQTTLPYSPYTNGKREEVLWGSVEGWLMAMPRRCRRSQPGPVQRGNPGLGRAGLQPKTPQRDRRHAASPASLAGPAVTRPCPDAAALRLAFTRTERCTLRKSDESRGHCRPSLRSVQPLSASLRLRGPLRRPGPHTGPSRRSPHRHGALPAVPAGQSGQCLRPAPRLAANSHRNGQIIIATITATATGARHRTIARANDRTAGRHRIAARLPAPGATKETRG